MQEDAPTTEPRHAPEEATSEPRHATKEEASPEPRFVPEEAAASEPRHAPEEESAPRCAPEEGAALRRAPFWTRYCAFVVDYLLIQAVAAHVAFGVVKVLDPDWDWPNVFFAWLLMVLVYLGVTVAYFSFFESSDLRATIGKRVFGLRVVFDEGEASVRRRAVLRIFLKFVHLAGILLAEWAFATIAVDIFGVRTGGFGLAVCAVVLFLALFALPMTHPDWRARGQLFHDRFAGTTVAVASERPWILEAATLFACAFCAVTGRSWVSGIAIGTIPQETYSIQSVILPDGTKTDVRVNLEPDSPVSSLSVPDAAVRSGKPLTLHVHPVREYNPTLNGLVRIGPIGRGS